MKTEKYRLEVDKNLKLIAKSSLVLFIGVIMSKVLTVLYRIVVARSFGTEAYGLFSILLMVEGLVLSVSLLGFSEGLLRQMSLYIGRKEENKIKYIFRKSLILLFFSSIISGILFFFLSDFLALEIFKNAELLLFLKIFSIIIPILIFLEIFMTILRAFEKIKMYSFIWNIFQGGIKLLLLIILIFLGFNIESIVFSYSVGILLTFIFSYLYCRYKLPQLFTKYSLKKESKKEITKDLITYSWPIIFMNLLFGFFYWIDSFLIGYFKGVSEVGLYNAAVPLATLLIITTPLFLKLFFPIIVKEYSKKNMPLIKEISKQIGKWVFMINFPIFVLMLLFPGAIINLFFGKDYLLASTALRFLSVGVMFYSIGLISSNLILMTGKSKILLWNAVLATLLNIFLNLIFIPMPTIFGIDNSSGINGAAFATMTSMILSNSLLIYKAKKYTSIIPIRKKIVRIILVTIIPTTLLLIFRSFITITFPALFLLGFLFLLIYLLLIFLTGGLDKNDFMILKLIKSKFNNEKDNLLNHTSPGYLFKKN